MHWYARPSRLLVRQVIGDVTLASWVLVWLWVSRVVDSAVRRVAEPVRSIAGTASGLSGDVADAGARVGSVPVVGPGLSAPFETASHRLDLLAGDAQQQVVAIERTATLVGLVVLLVPVLAAVALWLPGRLRTMRRADAVRRALDAGAGHDLLAWRALANQPLDVIAAASADPVGDLLRGRPEVVRALARAELRSLGLDLPEARRG